MIDPILGLENIQNDLKLISDWLVSKYGNDIDIDKEITSIKACWADLEWTKTSLLGKVEYPHLER